MRLLLRRRRASGVRHQGLATGPTGLARRRNRCMSFRLLWRHRRSERA